jgi:hypothetical protein
MPSKYTVMSYTEQLGYWRKHPNLHGYIVQNFASGIDDCKDVSLSIDDLEQIKNAVSNNLLVHTEGFFFGKSPDINSTNPDEVLYANELNEHTIQCIDKAIAFLNVESKEDVYKQVIYNASW